MSDTGIETQHGRLQDFTIDQFAGATALVLGSIGGLLMIIWKSRCLCRCRLGLSDKCYIFDCERAPPPLETDKKKEGSEEEDEHDTDDEPIVPNQPEAEPEPEPEPEVQP